MSPSIPLLVIVGPTAVGKTRTSLVLAEWLEGEIVSADSRYLYRGMDIATAKPTIEERARVPHHLIDVTTPDQPWSLAQYKRAATREISGIHARQRLPMLVGGTGQYVRAIVEGWAIPPRSDDPMMRKRLEAEACGGGRGLLHAWLAELDPEAATQIDPRNVRRIIRALEVCLTTGQPFSAQRTKKPPPYRIYILGLTIPRPNLYARIDARVEAMLRAGLVEEMQRLLAKGYDWDLPAMSALGYKQIAGYLRAEYDLDEAVRLIKRETRRFVRRQGTWFSARYLSIHWFDVNETSPAVLEREIRRWLNSRDVHR